MTTCVTLNCPFILYCREYNYLVDRGDSCEHMEQIIKKAKRFDRQRKKQANETEAAKLTVLKYGKGAFRLFRCEACKSEWWSGAIDPTFCSRCGKKFSKPLKDEAQSY